MGIVFRYKFGLVRLSTFFLGIVVGCNVFQALLVINNYLLTGTISLFQVIIILFILYGCTIGRSDFERLDAFLQQKYNGKRDTLNADFLSYVHYRKKLFLFHGCALLVTHLVWLMVDHYYFIASTEKVFIFKETFFYMLPMIYHNSPLNILSYLWIIVFLFDTCIIFYYFIWQLKYKTVAK
ncbi:hypothetical protein [Bacillus alkalicellulosilyticus]|uniref:hypothetical protein n=1 Tax=Alkalihalobacterium alkalicellulosilyticum TaxID=1912214 RepID=UPI000997F2AC|nr:hypothetical protein [Bacillus alkalicellulosilyticus]